MLDPRYHTMKIMAMDGWLFVYCTGCGWTMKTRISHHDQVQAAWQQHQDGDDR